MKKFFITLLCIGLVVGGFIGVKKYRAAKSINQLSNEIELSKSIWSDLERGKKDVQFTTFWRIAEALNVAPHKLLKDIEIELGAEFFKPVETKSDKSIFVCDYDGFNFLFHYFI